MLSLTILLSFATTLVNSRLIANYSCNFDESFCNWSHDVSLPLKWRLQRGRTPSSNTGPLADATGSGRYIYLEATGKKFGDKAGLVGPTMQGSHCMSFMYHMYGSTMGSIIVYIKTANKTKLVWVKTWSQGNQWLKAMVQINETQSYQIVFHGIRGQDWSSDAAIDEIEIIKDQCQTPSMKWLHVYFSENENNFKIDTNENAVTETWDYQFSFLALQTQVNDSNSIYFIYPPSCMDSQFTRTFSTIRLECYPFDFFYTSTICQSSNQSKVVLLNRMNGTYSKGIGLDGDLCCGENVEGFFYATVDVRYLSDCSPGWVRVGDTCIRFTTYARSGHWSRNRCLKEGGHQVITSTPDQFQALWRFIDKFRLGTWDSYFVGISPDDSTFRWIWKNGFKVNGDLIDIKNQHKKKKCGVLRRRNGNWELAGHDCNSKLMFACSKTTNNQCTKGWIRVNSTCFGVFGGEYIRNWDSAESGCARIRTILAIIDSKYMLNTLGEKLNQYLSASDVSIFVGLLYVAELRWNDGQQVDKRFWYPGQPSKLDTFTYDCVRLSLTKYGWLLMQISCQEHTKFICQMDERNVAYMMPTFENSSGISFGQHSYAVDGNYASCYQTKPSHNPWLKVRLAKRMFVAKIEITNRRSCCLKNDLHFQILLGNSTFTHCNKYKNVYYRNSIVFVCSQTIKTSDVTVKMNGKNRILTLCEIKIMAFENYEGLNGVLQKVWFDVSSSSLSRLRGDVRFPSQPDTIKTFKDFDSPSYRSGLYGSQMSTYIQVPMTGNYTFHIACDGECELWLDNNDVTSNHNIEMENNAKMIAKLDNDHLVDHKQWNRYPAKQSSRTMFLSSCLLYKLELLLKRYYGDGHSSVAMTLPNGTFEGPIKQKRLYWTYPGYNNLEFKINADKNILRSESSQTPLVVKVFYKYCCNGAYCPACPLKVSFKAIRTSVVVNESLSMDCIEYTTNIEVEMMVQPGQYPMKITTVYSDDIAARPHDRFVGTLVVLPKSIFYCDFKKDTCSLQNGYLNGTNQWNITRTYNGQYLTLTQQHQTAWLESAWLQSDQIIHSVGVCLTFEFLLPTSSQSSLQVLLKTSNNQNGSFVWRISGYQGNKWTKGQVFLKVQNTFKIIFMGTSLKEKSVGLDSVRLETSKCTQLPIHSKPGHKCDSIRDYQCLNGQCVDKEVVCDGDPDCIDDSDEENCTCLSNSFSCANGQCLKPSQLCDEENDCTNNAIDEKNCGQQCSNDHFQCVSGDCVSMSVTCDGIMDCEDGSDEPELCGFTGCPLNNISCSSSSETSFDHQCAFSEVRCDFEQGGLCGLTQELGRDLEWQLHSGFTPTRNTGPRYDHTTLDIKGTYLYIEASDRKVGEKAMLFSENIAGGQPICVSFWYHMNGDDIGSLNLYYKTNQKKVLVWQRKGHVSRMWLFGQANFNTTETVKIIFEGETGSGALGDIAIDDLSITYGRCMKIDYYENQSCYFDHDTCNWIASEGWKLTYIGKRPVEKDWQGSIGGYLYLSPLSTSPEVVTSPLIRARLNLKCLRFWHFLSSKKAYGSEFSVNLIADGTAIQLWRSSTEFQAWQYVQLPLIYSTDFRITIEAKRTTAFSNVLLDDITFSTETCDQIPRPGERIKHSYGAERHWRMDGSDSDLRTVGTMNFYPDNGNKVAYFDGHTGYFQSQALDFYFKSFSIVCWVNVRDSQRMNHVYSDWSFPFQFRLYAFLGQFCLQVRGVTVFKVIDICSEVPERTWSMLGFTWNLGTKTSTIYFNGMYYGKQRSPYSLQDLKVQITNHSLYEIGLKMDSNDKYNGLMRDLMVFYRTLNYTEMQTLYSPSRLSCPYHQTLRYECCVFPFIYKGILRYHCQETSNNHLWCSTTPSYDKDRKFDFCTDTFDCHAVNDGWCGWTNVTNYSWIRGQPKDMTALKTEVDNATNWNNNSGSSMEHDIYFQDGHSNYMNYTGIPDMTSYTICVWARTNDTVNAGTLFLYRVRDNNDFKVVISMIDYRGMRYVVNGKSTKKTSFRYNDGLWHHVCMRWNGDRRLLYGHIDQSNIFGTLTFIPENDKVPGGGELIVAVTKLQASGKQYGQFVGSLNGFNLWTRYLPDKDIRWMSVGCSGNFYTFIGHPLVSWKTLLASSVGQPLQTRQSTCQDIGGSRLLLNITNDGYPRTSIHESVIYERSSSSQMMCLRFSYVIYSPKQQTLRLYYMMKEQNYNPKLFWETTESSDSYSWKNVGVSIPGLSDFKVRFEGNVGHGPGFIAVKGINARNGKCIKSTHQTACKNTMTSSTGYLMSPFYPANYGPHTSCSWRIEVHPDSIIRLHFTFFEIEDHPTCDKDSISIFDDNKQIGKYCGTRYPEFVESSGNVMIVQFVSNGLIEAPGFKARYEEKPKRGTSKDTCMSYKGCPDGCDCSSISNGQDVSIKSRKDFLLTTIPAKILAGTKALHFQHNKISRLLTSDFNTDIAKQITYLDLSHNVLMHVQREAFLNFRKLKVLRLNSNFLRVIPSEAFSQTKDLTTLDLSHNLISKIEPTVFASMTSLTTLSLRSNKISALDGRTFANNDNLTALYLSFNDIEVISDDLLSNLRNLKILYLDNNKIKKFTVNTFRGLDSIQKLFLQDNNPTFFSAGLFKELTTLKEVRVDDFFLCCHANKAIPNVKCISPKDFFSSCSDLMKNKTLQVFIWILGLSALVGNLFVVILRTRAKEDNKVHSFLLTNLATADFLMGVYMLFIAVKDVEFQGEYFKHDFTWRNGMVCRIAGALSMLSSEVSVLLLTLITADRFKNIVFPFRGGRLSYKGACFAAILIWVICIVMSVLPIVNLQYFYDNTRRVGYYGRSALCLPLQITKDKLAGWEYSVGIFIILNLISFVFILCAYIIMFVTVTRSSRSIRSTSVNKESQLAKRMAFIIGTDFCCWVPVIIIGILSLLGLFHDPDHIVYAWLAVFVIPVNSSINPILYTFSTTLYFNKIMKNKIVSSFYPSTMLSRNSNNQQSTADSDSASTKHKKSSPLASKNKLSSIGKRLGCSRKIGGSDGLDSRKPSTVHILDTRI